VVAVDGDDRAALGHAGAHQVAARRSMLISPVNSRSHRGDGGVIALGVGPRDLDAPLSTTKKALFWSPGSKRISPRFTSRCWPMLAMRASCARQVGEHLVATVGVGVAIALFCHANAALAPALTE